MPGPAPNPNAQRRNARVGPRVLPKEGRKGPVPEWPLEVDATGEEFRFWERVWRKPQAVAWEENEMFESVARYVRLYLRSMGPKAPAIIHGHVTALENDLGLNPQSMRLLMWTVGEPEAKPVHKPAGEVTDIRNRMRAVG